jgi:formylglycine-generating enzyme required for sulfatase activity
MPVDPDRLQDIFLVAVELPATDRPAYLAEACGSDAELRAAVERLLAALAEPASILKLPAPAIEVAGRSLPPTDPHVPQTDAGTILVGRYKLLEQIGEGGMGTVWVAQQTEPVKRTVAVKLIKRGMDTRTVLARFEAERQALALMDHSNIAKVLDAGATADGRPFFVMDLVKGTPITQFCDTHRLTPRERLELFVPVCQAIQHAHQKGIIHRDIKPGNVLVAMYDDRAVPKVIDFGVAKAMGQPLTEQTFHTGFGTVIGTPQYMSPERATFNNLDVDTRSDLYSLGVLLYELLAGSPPFTKKDLEQAGILEMLRVVREVDPPRPSTKLSTADTLPSLAANRSTDPKKLTGMLRNELDWIVMKAIEKDRTRRYETANGFAADILRYLAGETVQAVPPRISYLFRKFVRKNRGPIAAAAIAMLVLLGAGIAAFTFQRTLAKTELDAERKRQEDLRTADEEARRIQEETRRETRAAALVQALGSAETARVPRLIDDLKDYRTLAQPKLREMAASGMTTKPGLHAWLALLNDEPGRAAGVVSYLPNCLPDELLPIRGLLKPHTAIVTPALWSTLLDANGDSGNRVRAACALAGLTPNDARWAIIAPVVTEIVVRANPVEYVTWAEALEPVRVHLLHPLMKNYPESRTRIESGKLTVPDLVTEASRFELLANLLARYTVDRPDELAELAMTVDARHYNLFSPAIAGNRAGVVPVLKAELGKSAFSGPGVLGGTLASVTGAPSVVSWLDPDSVFDALARRKGYAAAVLLALGEAKSVWQLFRHAPDPSLRSYLIERTAAVQIDPVVLIRRFEAETDLSAKRALLIALGDFPPTKAWAVERERLTGELLTLYRDDPDPGLHSAIDWLLRQRWAKAKELAAIDDMFAAVARRRALARVLPGVVPLSGAACVIDGAVRPLLPAPALSTTQNWFVNGEGQTYVVVRRPGEFVMGSPDTEPDRVGVNEPAHQKRIPRSFAISTREVTNAEFLRFLPNHIWLARHSPDRDSPALEVSWYVAAAYCNWLSAREGIPRDQWCYGPNDQGGYGEGMRIKEGHLSLTGYRLPTEAEWEYACRAGSGVSRYHGRSAELLGRYAWYVKSADHRAWPVSLLRPNDLGLFDILGNADEWVEDPGFPYGSLPREDTENKTQLVLRGRLKT